MQRGAFGGGDDIGRGAGARGFGDFDRSCVAPSALATRATASTASGKHVLLEIAAGNRDPQPADVLRQLRVDRLDRPRRARGIVGVRPLHRVIGQREIADIARERAEMIEARDERKRARPRQPAIGRLQAKNAAERRRHPDRAVGVRAQRDRHQAAADRTAGAAGRAAGHPCRIMRIARRAVMHVLAGEVVGVFAHVERADQHRAGGFHALDQRGVARRRRKVAVDLRARARRQALARRTGSSPRTARRRAGRPFAGGDRGIDRAGLGARAIGGDVGEGIQDGIVLGDPRQRRFGRRERGSSCGRPRPARFREPTAV